MAALPEHEAKNNMQPYKYFDIGHNDKILCYSLLNTYMYNNELLQESYITDVTQLTNESSDNV